MDNVTDIQDVDDPALCQVKCTKTWRTSSQYFGFNQHVSTYFYTKNKFKYWFSNQNRQKNSLEYYADFLMIRKLILLR